MKCRERSLPRSSTPKGLSPWRAMSDVQTAFGLVAARPASGARVLTGRYRPGGGGTADGEVAAGNERVDGEIVIGLVVRDVVLGPGGDGIHLHQLAGVVPRDDGGGRPGEGIHPLEAGHPGLATLEGPVEGNHLAHLTATVGSAGEGLGLGSGGEDTEVQVVAAADIFDVLKGLGEMEAGVQEEDFDALVDLDGEIDDDAILERAGQRHAGTEALDGPGDDLASRSGFQLVGTRLYLLRFDLDCAGGHDVV